MKSPMQQIANYAGEVASKAHFFGGFLDSEETTVLFFCNRGKALECKGLEALRSWLSSNGCVENGLAYCDENYSWVLIADSEDEWKFEPHSVITAAMQESGLDPAVVFLQSGIARCSESEEVLVFARNVLRQEPQAA